MPALEKTLIEVPITDGLAQKTDPTKLPVGKAVVAVNLVKNKEGRLEKRLGFEPLPNTSTVSTEYTPTGFSPNRGVAVSSFNQHLVSISKSQWNDTAATITTLQTYSEDTQSWAPRGLVSEVAVVQDATIANTPTTTSSITSIAYGDLQLIMWLAPTTVELGQLWYMVREMSTGSARVTPQIVTTDTDVICFRLQLVGTNAVLAYSTDAATAAINTLKIAVSAWTTTQFSTLTPSATITTNNDEFALFDMRSANDETHVIFAYQKLISSNKTIVASVCIVGSMSITGTVSLHTLNGTTEQQSGGYGIRCDPTNGLCVAWSVTNAAQSSGQAGSVMAATASYPGITVTTAAEVIYTLGTLEPPPSCIAVGFCQPGGGNPLYLIAWTASGSCWLGATSDPSQNSCIRSAFFQEGIGLVGEGNMTPGLVLMSQIVEGLNGMGYCLGWIPDSTQGSYILLACDWYQVDSGDGNNNTGYTLRPVANLQTRTALSDSPPILTSNYIAQPSVGNYQFIAQRTGLTEWVFCSLNYLTFGLTYVATAQGSKNIPAFGQIEFYPQAGYPTAQIGNLLAIGGALPSVFDGVNVIEQNFLYAPTLCQPNQVGFDSGGSGPNWGSAADGTYSWIITYEQPDSQGNYHVSARSTPLTLANTVLSPVANAIVAANNATQFGTTIYFTSLGPTLRQYATPNPDMLLPIRYMPPPAQPVKIGVYRTVLNGLQYFRVADKDYTGLDTSAPVNNTAVTVLSYTDTLSDAQLADGTHPLIYGDGTNGVPGALDDFCPPASPVQANYLERLFVARGNVVYFTKQGIAQTTQPLAPGYNDVSESFVVGGSDAITGMAAMDSTLVIFKAQPPLYYVAGSGPGNDGSGNIFTPQPIPCDVGCIEPRSIQSTPEGVYFMSSSGLRLLTRGLQVVYAGGPVEDELVDYPTVTATVLHPSANRVVFSAVQTDLEGPQVLGELILRDYVLDAWTTAILADYDVVKGFVSGTPALAPRLGLPPPAYGTVDGRSALGVSSLTLHLQDASGTVWREQDPNSLAPYYDNATYVSWFWTSAPIQAAQSAQGRFRVWDILTQIRSMNPHGLLVSVAVDYELSGQTKVWSWQGAPQPGVSMPITVNGVLTTNLTQLRDYDGRMGEAFQVTLQDVNDPASTTGQGAQLLGLTLSAGVYKGPYKLPPGTTQ